MTMITNPKDGNKLVTLEEAIERLQAKVIARGDLPYVSVKRQLELIDQMLEFDLGRHVLENGGIDAFWTHYVCMYPKDKASYKNISSLEEMFLSRLPAALATQERYKIFQQVIQNSLKEGCVLCSVPCGLMGNLSTIDYSHIKNFRLVGIDIDPQALLLAKKMADQYGLFAKAEFWQKDAWSLGMQNSFDLISSNGLNIYVSDRKKHIELYKQFHSALKPNGLLVISFLTPPPGRSNEWNMEEISKEDALLQRILFVDIVDAKFQNYHTWEEMQALLKEAGFKEMDVIYDKAHLFPTVVAKKTS